MNSGQVYINTGSGRVFGTSCIKRTKFSNKIKTHYSARVDTTRG